MKHDKQGKYSKARTVQCTVKALQLHMNELTCKDVMFNTLNIKKSGDLYIYCIHHETYNKRGCWEIILSLTVSTGFM